MDVSSEEGNPLLLVHKTLDEAYSERIAAMAFMRFCQNVGAGQVLPGSLGFCIRFLG